ncbi:MAG: GNAT family N-acetyltransferase [Desulfobacterales bacterium]|nr:GNAT family N-acetyltransferase [Desulfobacterales bacterium]
MHEVIVTLRENKLPIIKTNNLILRDIEIEDITPEYFQWLNKPNVNGFLEIRFVTQTEEMLRNYIQKKLEDTYNSKHFGVYDEEGTRLVGTVTLPSINWHHLYADISFVIGHPNAPKGKGYATDAVHGVVDYVFRYCGLKKLWAGYYDGHKASEHVLLKNGFQVEGRQRMLLINNKNKRVDNILVGLLSEDYLDVQLQL